MSFRLKMGTGNAAFADNNLKLEVVRVLNEVATRISIGDREGSCHDINGHKVGEWKLI